MRANVIGAKALGLLSSIIRSSYFFLFKIPTEVAKYIEMLMKAYLWVGCEKGKNLVRWEIVS